MDREMDEIHRHTTGALTATVSAAALVAETLSAAVAAHLRRAAERTREHARQERARVAAMRNVDAGIWRAATRRSWWRTATAEDISRAWRAASAWHWVDPEAERARRYIVERLAERGVTIGATSRMDAGDVQWLRTALELHVRQSWAEERAEPGPEIAPGHGPDPGRIDHTDADRDRMATRVRDRWSPQRASAVLESGAWPALAYRLHQHEALGGDVDTMLDSINLQGARNPAALAEWQTENANLALMEQPPRGALTDEHRESGLVGERQPADQDPARAPGPAATRPVNQDRVSPRSAAELAAEAYPADTRTAVNRAARERQKDAGRSARRQTGRRSRPHQQPTERER